MATNRISVLIDVTVDKANRALTDFKTKVADADGAVGKLKAGTKSAMDSLRANSGAAATVAGAALFKFGKDAVDAASSLEQSIGGIEKAFGDAAEAVLAIGRNADESMGLSQRAFNEGALALSAFAEDIAKDTGEPVEKVITDLMTRAADFAAAYGTTVPEAVRIFSSTLSGESEPIKRFGIIVNETETKAYAAEAGIEDMGKATQRAGLLMRDTAKFAGQFADEGDTLAGAQARLGAKIENLQAQLGEELLPVVADVTSGVADLVDGWNMLGELPPVKLAIEVTGNDTLLGTIKSGLDASAGIPGLDYAVGKITGTFKKWDDATLITEGAIGDLTGEVDETTEATDRQTSALDRVTAALGWASRAAEDARRDTEDLERAFRNLRDEISDDSAYLDLQDSFDDVKVAGAEAWEAASTGAADAEVKAREYQRAQIDTKNNVLDYIETLGDVPIEQTTEIIALIDEGKLAEAEERLGMLARIRIALITPQVTQPYGGVPDLTPGAKFHSGGVVGIGNFASDEVPAVLQKGEMVLTKGQQASLMGGGPTIHLTVNALNPQQAGKEIAKSLEAFYRGGGRRV